MINVDKTIISQYCSSPVLVQLIKNMDQYIDPRIDIDQFYSFIWNVDTAQGFGLDIWGRIVGVKRSLNIPDASLFFGYSEGVPGAYCFDEQAFYIGANTTNTYTLADDAYRKLILIKALANITNTTAPALNQLLQSLFINRGRCYVNDLGDMRMRYTFEFLLTSFELAIMLNAGIIPKPAGVQAQLINLELPVFGFSEAGTVTSAPFGQGTFRTENSSYVIN